MGDPRNGGTLFGTALTAGPVGTGINANVNLTVPVTFTVNGPVWVVAGDTGNINWQFKEQNYANNFFNSQIFPAAPVWTPTPSAKHAEPAINLTPECLGPYLSTPEINAISGFLPQSVITNANGVAGFDYAEGLDSIIFSVNHVNTTVYQNPMVTPTPTPSGILWNLEQIVPGGRHNIFTNVGGLTGDLPVMAVRTGCASTSIGGFIKGTIYAGTGTAGGIMKISADGLTTTMPWVTLPGEPGIVRGLTLDHVGTFNGDIIAITASGNIWKIDVSGNAAMIYNQVNFMDTKTIMGLDVIPNNQVIYGPWAGKLLFGSIDTSLESSGDTFNAKKLHTLDAAGIVQDYSFGAAPSSIKMFRPNENLFIGDSFGYIYGIQVGMMTSLTGGILMADEDNGNIYMISGGMGII
jgi:hypothetical protein